jgi:hypothetical protein
MIGGDEFPSSHLHLLGLRAMVYRKDIPNQIWDKLGIYGISLEKRD